MDEVFFANKNVIYIIVETCVVRGPLWWGRGKTPEIIQANREVTNRLFERESQVQSQVASKAR